MPVIVAGALVATAALGPAAGAAPSSSSPAARPASGAPTKVIVLLGAGRHTLPAATPGHLAARRAAISTGQSPVRTQIGRLGGRTTKAYRAVDALAATVPSGGLAALRALPGVTAVVPDLPITEATPSGAESRSGTKASTPTSRADATGDAYCPTDPSQPLLEPEALTLTHTDSQSAGTPTARSLGYTGAGVTVGVIADGTDVNQPDLIRADGSHVVTDYQDFSGDGTDASSSGAEAMGDVSSIAAQGRTSYDLSQFVNPAHPLPTGCNIRIEGMAPGASLVSLKVFPNNLLTAPTSTIVQAIDYAVNVDHVNVLNESFGSNPYPDNATDPISIANQDAIDAGVSVVASSGDAGSGNSLGTASTDPNVIGVGATTSEQSYAQTGAYGFPLSNGKYASDQLSGLSSAGISQTNRVVDLLAPGDLGWALCSDATLGDGTPQYYSCLDNSSAGAPSNIQLFGGTSEAAPLTSGAAALVIQAYRAGHQGLTPTPAVIRSILDSSADDLGLPADEQGAGVLDTYRAVQLARSFHASARSGQELNLNRTQTSNVAAAGTHVGNAFTLTNNGTGPQRVTAAVRAVSHVSSTQVQQVAFDASTAPTFLDSLGRARPYALKTFTVPAGTDRLDAAVSVAGDGTKYVRASLLDPQGTFTAYTLPQGTGNYAHVDVHQPAPGTWTAIVWSSAAAASVTGPIALRTTYYTATSVGTVSPASVTIPAGSAQRFVVATTVPASEATAASVVFTHRFGQTTTASVIDRAVQKVSTGHPAKFSGVFDSGNGRSYGPAQSFTYLVDVPSGAKDLDVNVAVAGTPSNQIIAHLSDPSGEPVTTARNDLPGTDTAAGTSYGGLQIVHADPVPGRYQLSLELPVQSSGAALPQRFSGSFALDGADVSSNLPAHVTVSKAGGLTGKVHIVNTSPMPQTYFLDGRLATSTNYRLVAGDVVGDPPNASDPYSTTATLPLASDDVVPAWLVPTQVSRLTVGASATDPIAFDLMPLDDPTSANAPNNPDTEAVTSGNSATAVHAAGEVASTQWAAFPSPVGPVAAGGAQLSASFQAVARARTFDADVSSTTGDLLLGSVDANAAAAAPITLLPGSSTTIRVHFTPQGKVGSAHAGSLFVDVAQPFGPVGGSTLTEEVASLPYSYTVGK